MLRRPPASTRTDPPLPYTPPVRSVVLVQEGEAESEAEFAEDALVLGPGDDGTWRHHGGNIAVDEAAARHVGELHHLGDGLAALFVTHRRRRSEEHTSDSSH